MHRPTPACPREPRRRVPVPGGIMRPSRRYRVVPRSSRTSFGRTSWKRDGRWRSHSSSGSNTCPSTSITRWSFMAPRSCSACIRPGPAHRRGVGGDVAEGDLLVGPGFGRQSEDPLADHVALDLIASSGDAELYGTEKAVLPGTVVRGRAGPERVPSRALDGQRQLVQPLLVVGVEQLQDRRRRRPPGRRVPPPAYVGRETEAARRRCTQRRCRWRTTLSPVLP